jgi:hypothetical protein
MVQMANGHCHTLTTSAALDRVGRRAGYAGRNRFGWNKSLSSWLGEQIGGSNGSDNALPEMRKTNAPGTISGRTDLQCISCDDPAVKWAESPVTVPEKPIVLDRVTVMKE